jgi:hypothetical protein
MGGNNEDVEARLKQDLASARSRLDLANKKFDRCSELASSLGLNHAHGAFALRKATKEHNAALRGYVKAMERFSNFIVHGRVPPEWK